MINRLVRILFCFILASLPLLAWGCGYYYGKVCGICQVRHLMNEQWKDYESFRDLVFHKIGVKVDE